MFEELPQTILILQGNKNIHVTCEREGHICRKLANIPTLGKAIKKQQQQSHHLNSCNILLLLNIDMCQIEPHIWDVSGGFANLKDVMKYRCEYSPYFNVSVESLFIKKRATSLFIFRVFVLHITCENTSRASLRKFLCARMQPGK